jgi:hypothetical protein
MADQNLIRFDSAYMREYSKTVNAAQRLAAEALNSLKGANRHDGWQCRERGQINEDLSKISDSAGKLGNAMKDLSSKLNKGAGQLENLEQRSSSLEGTVSNQLKKNWGFEALKWLAGAIGSAFNGIGEKIKLPETRIPKLPNPLDIIFPPKVNAAVPWIEDGRVLPDTKEGIGEKLKKWIKEWMGGNIFKKDDKVEIPDFSKPYTPTPSPDNKKSLNIFGNIEKGLPFWAKWKLPFTSKVPTLSNRKDK